MIEKFYRAMGASLFTLAAIAFNSEGLEHSNLRQQYFSQQQTITAEVREQANEYAWKRGAYNAAENLMFAGGLIAGAYIALGGLELKKQ